MTLLRESVTRPCAYRPCGHYLPPDAQPNQRYHHPKCRTADWKARRASQTTSGVVAVRSLLGDAENARIESRRARELREARARGPVASDRRVQYARACTVLACYLRSLNVADPERVAARVLAGALPESRRAA